MNSTSARALVTGGAGFIGSALVDLLVDESWDVLVIDDLSTGHADNLQQARRRGRVQLHTVDIRDESLVSVTERFRPDVVFHLAAQVSVATSVLRPLQDAEVNVLGAINVLEATRRAGASRLVLAGSAATYGSGAKLPIRESYARRPESPYGVSKLAAESYARMYADRYGIEIVTLTPSNVYGPRQRSSGEGGVVAEFAAMVTEGRQPTIFGDGKATRDFVYVDDVADAFLRAAARAAGKNLNISTGVETSVADLFDLIAGLGGFRRGPRISDVRPGDVERSVLDPTAAERYLGWSAWTSLEEGLSQTLDWVKGRR